MGNLCLDIWAQSRFCVISQFGKKNIEFKKDFNEST